MTEHQFFIGVAFLIGIVVGKILTVVCAKNPEAKAMTSKEASQMSAVIRSAQLPLKVTKDIKNARIAIQNAVESGESLAKIGYSICGEAVEILESEGYMVWRPGGFGLPYHTNISFTS